MTRKLQIGPKEPARPHARHPSSRPFVELQHSLPGQVVAISPAVDMVMSFVAKLRKIDGNEANIEMALHETLTNAVVHGSHEDQNKRVFVVCRCSIDGEVSITVRDEGPGFDSRAVPDPTTLENRLCIHGRGIYLMKTLMNEVHFDEDGTVVRMRKKSPQRKPE